MPLFIFISGRLFKDEYIVKPFYYISKKFKSLMIPYYFFNLIALVLCLLFGNLLGIGSIPVISSETVLYKFFVEPFIYGQQFILNLAGWFVPQLFLIQSIFVCIYCLFKIDNRCKDILVISIALALGMVVLYYQENIIAFLDPYIGRFYGTFIRTCFLMPFFLIGRFYQRVVIKHDKCNSTLYFIIIFVIQAITFYIVDKYKLGIYSTVVFNTYRPGFFFSFFTPLVGIAFWVRISRLLTPLLSNVKWFVYLGKNTSIVMYLHVFVFFAINYILSIVNNVIPIGFDVAKFNKSIWYYYAIIGEKTGLFYCIAAIAIPLIIKHIYDTCDSKTCLKIKNFVRAVTR